MSDSGNTSRNTGPRASRPNIVLILVDDMGYSDIGCYGSEIRTPNVDRLAAEGIRFTQMYNCARCCPSRASLLTGLYPHQAGVGHMVGDSGLDGYRGFLQQNCVTIAEVLARAGYRTFMSGKWHVGGYYPPNQPDTWRPGDEGHPTPIQRGFEEHYGMLGGGGSYFDPPSLHHNDIRVVIPGDEDYYFTDAISDNAVRMIGEAGRGDAPFFLYVGYTAPHWPLHALPEDIARYEGKYGGGWDAVRTARHEELKGMGILNPKWNISPRDEQAPDWSDVPPKLKTWQNLRMAVYAAQIDRMDQGVGRICARLRELGIEDDTLVMFMSDNGGCAEFLAEDVGRPQPHRYNIPTRDGRPMHVGNTPALRPGPDDTFMSYDLPWANASNTPFRLYKHWVHEGGIATPFVVHWPKAATRGGIRHQPVHFIDVMATCLDAAGARYPEEHNGQPVTPLEGESLLPALGSDAWSRERPIFWEHEGNRAVRLDNWKLVSKYPGGWELYDMNEDRTELNDLAPGNAATVDRLARMYDEWAERVGVLPWEQVTGAPEKTSRPGMRA